MKVILVYVLVSIFTFGHAYNHYPDKEEGHFGSQTYTIHNGPGTKTFGSMLASMAWPLYWSVRLQ